MKPLFAQKQGSRGVRLIRSHGDGHLRKAAPGQSGLGESRTSAVSMGDSHKALLPQNAKDSPVKRRGPLFPHQTWAALAWCVAGRSSDATSHSAMAPHRVCSLLPAGSGLRGCSSRAMGGMGQPQEVPGLGVEGAFCRFKGKNGQEGVVLCRKRMSHPSATVDGTG